MCQHENLKTVNNRLFCKDCGEELPLAFLTREKEPEQKPEEKPKARRKKKEVSE